jgi:hypothetical protein
MQKRQGLFHGIGLGLNEIRPASRLRAVKPDGCAD